MTILKQSRSAIGGGTAGAGAADGAFGEESVVVTGGVAVGASGAAAGVFGSGIGITARASDPTML